MGYPDVPPSITLRALSGNIPKESIDWLQSSLEDFAAERVGVPVLFDLVEHLKQESPAIGQFVDAGHFGSLGDELISCVLDFVPPRDLGSEFRSDLFGVIPDFSAYAVSMTFLSKRWCRIASDSKLRVLCCRNISPWRPLNFPSLLTGGALGV